VKGSTPYLLEYNCRFGDPETQAVLVGLKSDFLILIEDTVYSRLSDTVLKWEDKKQCVS
jgi:phosphoribosylamine---glycine ligase